MDNIRVCVPVNRNRVGNVMITRKAVNAGYAREMFTYMKATIVNASAVYHNDSIEYTFYSDILPEISSGEIIPSYDIDIIMSSRNNITDINIGLL